MKLERHPLSKLWPDIPSDEFAELRTDIGEHGQRYPIIVYDKQILDGWHRYKACLDLGVKPNIEKFTGTPEAAAKIVNSLNAHRRNLTASQRAFAITGCFEWARANIKGRGSREPLVEESEEESKTNAEMAQAAGASRSTVKRSKKVHQSGSAALKEAVKAGEVSINKAASVVDLPKSEQLKAATQKSKPSPVEVAPAPDFDFDGYEPEDDEEYKKNIENVMMADDKLAAMREELKQLRREFQGMKSEKDHYQNQCGVAVRFVKDRDNEIKKLKAENAALRKQLATMEKAA